MESYVKIDNYVLLFELNEKENTQSKKKEIYSYTFLTKISWK